MSAPSANALYHEAQRLVKAGQPVFPCHSVTKSEKIKAKAPIGSFVKNGLKEATLDVSTIKRWIKTRDGDLALGLPTGIVWDVLDVDIKDSADGRIHLPYLNRLGLLNGCKFVVRTPSGGWHLYFKAAKGLTNKARGASLGLDVRAKGGYVLAPPSFIDDREGSTGCYLNMGETKGSTDDPLLWDLIVSALSPMDTEANKPVPLLPSERRASVASLREWLSVRQAGERNNALHWAVCRCIESGIDPHEMVEPALLIGLEEHEILLTINSALKRAGVKAEELVSEVEAMFPDE